MYKLKTIAQKSMMLAAVATLVTASLPPVQVFAYNELNPLTERSLLLSSSAPGYVDTDGSGNTTSAPNPTGEAYAPAGSGANGKKTGETFSFKVSTDSVATSRPIKAFTFQYCTSAAGYCQAPGNNLGDARSGATVARETNAVAHADVNAAERRSDFEAVYATPVQGEDFDVYVNGSTTPSAETWVMTTSNKEDDEHTGELTGKDNYITLTSATGEAPTFNQEIKVVFRASEDQYITNPGGGSFFVKINTYDSDTAQTDAERIDGGVTVANMMTDSIHITTKVLETMQFSVGIELPEQNNSGNYSQCSPINVVNNNRINLGNINAENSLETDRAHEQKSYWRIQSNSSGGATIYYSGDTLRNTVGDEIQPMSVGKVPQVQMVDHDNNAGTPAVERVNYTGYGDPEFKESQPSTEQFGLALVAPSNAAATLTGEKIHFGDDGDVDAAYNTAKAASGGVLKDLVIDPLTATGGYSLTAGMGNAKTDPTITAGQYTNPYTGSVQTDTSSADDAGFAKFGFTPRSVTIPQPIASGNEVLSCTTGKMRYVGNIAADTPAGVYTTKINYLAAPKY